MRISSNINFVIKIYIFIFIIFSLFMLFSNRSKSNYEHYKNYETKINNKMDSIVSSNYNLTKKYYDNASSKLSLIINTEYSYLRLESLYKNFLWNKGDNATLQLYLMKKQILLDYAEMYKKKLSYLITGKSYDDEYYMKSINVLEHNYLIKDEEECKKLHIPFEENSELQMIN